MKQQDVALLIVIAFISAIASFIISTKIFVTPTNRQQKVETIDVITPDFQTPSARYFNTQSIDPAQPVQTGNNNNQNPFNNPTD